jgi:hypothetical protein
MFYFFEKDHAYLRCEIRAGVSAGYEILIVEPGGQERVERYSTSQEAQQRWQALQTRFVSDGWFGPFGRE